MDYRNKKAVVLGMARTGMAAAAALKELGAEVTLYDRKPLHELDVAIAEARRLAIEAHTGTENVDLSGADMLVPSPGVRADHPALAAARDLGVEIVSEIELAYRISPAPIIAVTGTNGKTTTTILIARMLQAAGLDALIAGNVAAGEIQLPLVTAAMRAKPESVLVAEISSFQLEWITGFRPKIGALLNITADHMDRHSDMNEYASLKARLFEYQQTDDFAVLNADDGMVMERTRDIPSQRLLFSRQNEQAEGAWVSGEDIVVRIGESTERICAVSEIPLKGMHNVENVLAASAAAVAFGIDPSCAAKAIRDFTPIEHRLEPVAEIDGIEYINNSMCTNAKALERSLEAMDRPVVLIAGGKFKGDADELNEVASAISRLARQVVLIGVSAEAMAEAINALDFHSVTRAESMEDAVEKATLLARPGDTVLLAPACASFDMFDDFEHRGRVFKDAVRKQGNYFGTGVSRSNANNETAGHGHPDATRIRDEGDE